MGDFIFFWLKTLLFSFALAERGPWLQGDSVPKSCYSSRDCTSEGARCFEGQCACLSTSVRVGSRCLPKLRPGQSPCLSDEQCQAVWPETQCVNTICQCVDGVHVKTRDGIVCVKYQSCPLGGSAPILRNQNGTKADCYISPTGFMSGCMDQLHMFDCIRDKFRNENFYCCPNKANTCSQPLDIGKLPAQTTSTRAPVVTVKPKKKLPWYLRQDGQFPVIREETENLGIKRWYYDRVKGACSEFTFLGEGGNANNFLTKDHCENFCRTTCPRGSPMFQKGPEGGVHQYLQRQQICAPAIGCGNPLYSCDILQPGKALCCPNRDFLCSEFGGLPQRQLQEPFDEGVSCSNYEAVDRFYYDKSSKSCKRFSYKGCSGNFNNFASLEDCETFCIIEPVLLQQSANGTFNSFQFIWRNPRVSTFG